MILNLVTNGIFPIRYDIDGNTLPDLPDTGYDLVGTLQGEGKLLGVPTLFIRSSACNLKCAWVGAHGKGSICDTPYSSFHPQKNRMEVEDILKLVKLNTENTAIRTVVVSGGEPTMQPGPLAALLKGLQEMGMHTTIETNGTLYDEEVARYTNLVSMSPKLSSSTPWEANLVETGIKYNERVANTHEKGRYNLESFQRYIDGCYRRGFAPNGGVVLERYAGLVKDFQLKFVVSCQADIEEIKRDFLDKLTGVEALDVCLMPEGITPEDLMNRSGWVAREAIANGWRFTPRLHALLWGIKQGV